MEMFDPVKKSWRGAGLSARFHTKPSETLSHVCTFLPAAAVNTIPTTRERNIDFMKLCKVYLFLLHLDEFHNAAEQQPTFKHTSDGN